MKRAKKQIRQEVTRELAQVLDLKLFKVFSEPVRVELLKILLIQGRSDISYLSSQLPQDRSVISRHLQIMLDTEILFCQKVGRSRYYKINGENLLSRFDALAENFRDTVAACCP